MLLAELYIRKADAYERTTQPSARELANRDRFTAVSQAVAERSVDLTRMTADQTAFMAQKDEPGGKKTMKSYLWKVEADAYDAEHPRS